MRKKVKLAYITNNSRRRKTFNVRKRGVLKKLDEIKILCDVDACAVIYSPYNSTPEAWPSNSEVRKVIEKFELLPEDEQAKRSVSHEEFLVQTITKVKNKVNRLRGRNNDKLMEEVMFSCLNGNMGDLIIDDSNRDDLCEFIDGYLKKLYHHRNLILKNSHLETGAPIFNPPQLTNEMHQPIITSNQGSDHVDALASNLFPFSNHGVNTQVMNQDQHNYPLNPQDWYAEEMMKHSEPTCCPWMEENHHYNHRQF